MGHTQGHTKKIWHVLLVDNEFVEFPNACTISIYTLYVYTCLRGAALDNIFQITTYNIHHTWWVIYNVTNNIYHSLCIKYIIHVNFLLGYSSSFIDDIYITPELVQHGYTCMSIYASWNYNSETWINQNDICLCKIAITAGTIFVGYPKFLSLSSIYLVQQCNFLVSIPANAWSQKWIFYLELMTSKHMTICMHVKPTAAGIIWIHVCMYQWLRIINEY